MGIRRIRIINVQYSVVLVLLANLWSLGSNAYERHYYPYGPPPPPMPEPEPYESYEIVFPGEAVIKHYPRGDRNYGSSSNSNSDSYGRSNPDEETLTRDASRCGGLCVPPAHCASLKGKARGFCGPSGQGPRVCCAFEKSCEASSSEVSTSFQSPGYPGPTLGTLVCQYDIHLQPGVCSVKIEFKEFNTTEPLDRGLCNVDQLLILNALEGATFPRCGELTGYSTIVAVDPRHRLPLTLLSIIQSSKEQFKWNIQLTQVKCDSVQRIQDHPNCGKSFVDSSGSSGKEINGKEVISSVEENTNVPTTTLATDVSDVENIIVDSDRLTVIEKSYNLKNRQSVDNAFYINYLKQAHDAIVSSINNITTSPNSTLCRNKDFDIESEKIMRYKSSTTLGMDISEEFGRIIRGSEAQLSEFPWQVSIQDDDGHICGGAIISPTAILTASHCFLSIAPVPISSLKIAVGDLNLNSTTESESEYVDISTITFHSHFDPFYLGNDISLINLKNPLTFRNNVQPICLPERGNSYTGKRGIVSGWGATSYPQGKLASNLQRASTEIIENSECRKKLKIDYVYSTMLCAIAGNCSGTCFGDSGGPLVVRDKETGTSTLVGLVSFGIGGCALFPYWPDVYTRVASFLDWTSYAVV